jgi:hypothetical protein
MKRCPRCGALQKDEVEVCDCGHEFTALKKGPRVPPELATTALLLFIELSVLGLIAALTAGNIVTHIVEGDSDAAAVYIAMLSIPFIVVNVINLSHKITFIISGAVSVIVINVLSVWNLAVSAVYPSYETGIAVFFFVLTNLVFAGLIVYFCYRLKKYGG